MTGLVVRMFSASLRLYQLLVSPWFGPMCRFQPSCSQYAIDAVAEFGVVRGGWFAICRLGRCHPLGDSGYDPIKVRATNGS